MHDIFISYANQDKETAHALAQAFAKEGLSVWWDREIPTGSTFDAIIEKAIDNAKCIVVLWSEHSIKSEWVHIEAAEGRHRNVLVPILIGDVEIPLAFRRRQTANLCNWLNGNEDPAYTRLINDIRRLLGSEITDSEPTVKAAPPIGPMTTEKQHSNTKGISTSGKKKMSKYAIIAGFLTITAAVLYFAFPLVSGNKKTLKIGDSYQAGLIFDVDPDGLSVKICSKTDLGFMDWYQAKDICSTYTNGDYSDWYLPTIEELELMHNNLYLNDLGDFKREWYWSSSETDGKAWELDFEMGYKQNDGGGNESDSFVRAVRTIKLKQLKIGDKHAGGIIFEIDSTGKHGKVCSESNLGFVNWYQAKKLCEDYSNKDYDDWYLPSLDELDLMYGRLYHNNIGDFKEEWYWSSDVTDGQAWEIEFTDGYHQNDGGGNESMSFVRAVRKF